MSDSPTQITAKDTSLNKWDEQALTSRIENPKSHKRFEAGSPNEVEIRAYKAAILNPDQNGEALVLGMTPELRQLALNSFTRVISVDINSKAIPIYKDCFI